MSNSLQAQEAKKGRTFCAAVITAEGALEQMKMKPSDVRDLGAPDGPRNEEKAGPSRSKANKKQFLCRLENKDDNSLLFDLNKIVFPELQKPD